GEFDFSEAESGHEALEMLAGTPVEKLPDVIILDRMLPRMSGDECVKAIRNVEEWKNIPIIFLTADAQSEHILEALEGLGVEDYIVKPFGGRELTARVKV